MKSRFLIALLINNGNMCNDTRLTDFNYVVVLQLQVPGGSTGQYIW